MNGTAITESVKNSSAPSPSEESARRSSFPGPPFFCLANSALNSISGGMSVYRSCSLQSHSFAGVGVCTTGPSEPPFDGERGGERVGLSLARAFFFLLYGVGETQSGER